MGLSHEFCPGVRRLAAALRDRGRGIGVAVLLACAAAFSATAAEPQPLRNLFQEYLHRTPAEIDAKIAAAWEQFNAGDPRTQRLVYPVGDDAAYVFDTGNRDVRSEGMSYGLMIAVQLDRQEEFNRLWTWTKRYMFHADGPRRGYYAWQVTPEGNKVDPGSASDGEEWFATVLFLASRRWGDGEGIFDYGREAQALLDAMRDDNRGGDVRAIFHAGERQVVFAPSRAGYRLTDPSYHLPAFTALWAHWDQNTEGRAFWAEVTETSRAFFRRSAHPVTGLFPEYAHFDGAPFVSDEFGPGKEDFRFDAWRTLANVAIDHASWAQDPWQVEQSNRVLRFLGRWGEICPNQFTLAGVPLSAEGSTGLTGMAAVAGLAADRRLAQPWVERLWDAEIPEGQWRYYNGLLYLLALLQVGGRFHIH